MTILRRQPETWIDSGSRANSPPCHNERLTGRRTGEESALVVFWKVEDARRTLKESGTELTRIAVLRWTAERIF